MLLIPIMQTLLHKKAEVCCDPTLLLPPEEWRKLGKKGKERKPYILVYYVTRTEKLQEYAKKLSEKKKMKVICVSANMALDVITGGADRRFGFDCRMTCSPDEFVSLFRDAAYVLTNSFHGSVFSILFHKQFLVQTQLDNGKVNARAVALMDDLGIAGRELREEANIDLELPWEKIDERRNEKCQKGLAYLRKIG